MAAPLHRTLPLLSAQAMQSTVGQHWGIDHAQDGIASRSRPTEIAEPFRPSKKSLLPSLASTPTLPMPLAGAARFLLPRDHKAEFRASQNAVVTRSRDLPLPSLSEPRGPLARCHSEKSNSPTRRTYSATGLSESMQRTAVSLRSRLNEPRVRHSGYGSKGFRADQRYR